MASAPEIQIRTDVRSRSSAPASSSIRYMAGTPTKTEQRRVSMASSTTSALNRGRNHTGTPVAARPTRVMKPMMWAIGRLTTASSSRREARPQRTGA